MTYQFQVIFQGNSNLPQDQFVNTWHFDHTGLPTGTDYDDVRNMLNDFYCVAPTGNAIRTYLSGQMSLTVKVKAYDLSQPKPRAPVYSSQFVSAGWAGGNTLPQEMACCFSFEAAKVSGKVQRRRRNRVYLGPLAFGTILTSGNMSPTVAQDMVNAGGRLHSASDSSVSWNWVVYSPMLGESYDVQHLWVDDAYDVQRRRGINPTTRKQLTY